MTDLFPSAMAFVWRPDFDGQGFHCDLNDPGGATSWGVTFQTWAGWQRLHGAPVSMADFKACQKADFLPIYRSLFWNSVRAGNLGVIGIQVFDVAMNSGPGNAGLFLQHTLNAIGARLVADGQIGPKTVIAANGAPPAALNFALCNERMRFYASLPTARYFERGWDRRAEACRDLVASMIPSTPAGAPATKGA